MNPAILSFLMLLASFGFILTLQGLSSVKSARRGNIIGICSMALSIGVVLMALSPHVFPKILAATSLGALMGGLIASRTPMMALPQLMAAFHSLVGLAAVFVAGGAFRSPEAFGIPPVHSLGTCAEIGLGATIGAITFSGSLLAYAKLQGASFLKFLTTIQRLSPWLRNLYTLLWLGSFIWFLTDSSDIGLWTLVSLGGLLGVFLVLPIGGADMPVVVSMLNSYSGWAAAGIGFTLDNSLLIIVGALVGSSGAVLSYVMCVGMNRPFWKVIFGGTSVAATDTSSEIRSFKQGNPEDAAFLLQAAQKIIVVPGYGMAVAQAQHALKEMVDLLESAGAHVQFAVHPVAGRMPGHMNVLLAEAGVSYEAVHELEEINGDFSQTDVVFVIGANDITNTSAKTDPQSPLYGMPILDVAKAKTILFVKRSMGAGYAGVDNPLFYQDNTFMLLGDAKKVCDEIVRSLRAS